MITLFFRPYNDISKRMSRCFCLSILMISVGSNVNKFFEYYTEEKIKVGKYYLRGGLFHSRCLQEIPDNFYIAGARNISSNLSTVTWNTILCAGCDCDETAEDPDSFCVGGEVCKVSLLWCLIIFGRLRFSVEGLGQC